MTCGDEDAATVMPGVLGFVDVLVALSRSTLVLRGHRVHIESRKCCTIYCMNDSNRHLHFTLNVSYMWC